MFNRVAGAMDYGQQATVQRLNGEIMDGNWHMQAISLSTTWVRMQAVSADVNTMCPSWHDWMICGKLSDNLLVLKLMTCNSNYYSYWNFSTRKDQKFILQQTDRKMIMYTTLKQSVSKHHNLWHGTITEFVQNNWEKNIKNFSPDI
jgi:hypothetical protein